MNRVSGSDSVHIESAKHQTEEVSMPSGIAEDKISSEPLSFFLSLSLSSTTPRKFCRCKERRKDCWYCLMQATYLQ